MNGSPATSSIALGTCSVSGRSRVASPPACSATGGIVAPAEGRVISHPSVRCRPLAWYSDAETPTIQYNQVWPDRLPVATCHHGATVWIRNIHKREQHRRIFDE